MFQAGAEIFPLTAASILAVRPTQSLIRQIPGALALGVRWQECEPDQHLYPVMRLRKCGAIPPLPICPHALVINYVQGQLYGTLAIVDKTG